MPISLSRIQPRLVSHRPLHCIRLLQPSTRSIALGPHRSDPKPTTTKAKLSPFQDRMQFIKESMYTLSGAIAGGVLVGVLVLTGYSV